MRVAVVLLVLCIVYHTSAETCSSNGDCTNTVCDSTHDLECHNGQCTCVNHVSSCSSASDCSGNCRFFGRHGKWHCVDAKCRCFLV
ncbi:serine protease inhibitor Cvsi-2-like [Ostrea edulis]|uniref:serine protease inhibitor Cvsi-2-like n=1 Tax=Ostrea edulis TaxID=37623 RepID=UPI0024AF9C9B|nr:serine protease inhibitor Cvsi-2-like [Ostrea edulis]